MWKAPMGASTCVYAVAGPAQALPKLEGALREAVCFARALMCLPVHHASQLSHASALSAPEQCRPPLQTPDRESAGASPTRHPLPRDALLRCAAECLAVSALGLQP